MSSDESITDDDEVTKRRRTALAPPAPRQHPRAAAAPPPPPDSWIDKYAPTLETLCLHPRKLSDLRAVLNRMVAAAQGNPAPAPRLLVVHGPAGTSKSTAVKLLAAALLPQSRQPVVEYAPSAHASDADSFAEFLSGARYRCTAAHASVVLVEELPNVLSEHVHRRLQAALDEWCHADDARPPLVVCVTEVELARGADDDGAPWRRDLYTIQNTLTVDTLLGRRLASDARVAQVRFNAIAPTYLKRTLQRVVSHERAVFAAIAPQKVQRFIAASAGSGDVRSSIANLQFWAGAAGGAAADRSLATLSAAKEAQLSLFHAVGKCIYGSEPKGGAAVADAAATADAAVADAAASADAAVANPDSAAVADVLAHHGSNTLLQLTLLENYGVFRHPHFGVAHAAQIASYLSAGDILPPAYGRELGIRGTRSVLRGVGEHQRAAGGARRIQFPSHYKLLREYGRVRREVRDYQHYLRPTVSFDNLNMVHGCYEPRIYNSAQRRGGGAYGRLGGAFRMIFPSDDLPLAEDDSEARAEDQYAARIRQAQAEAHVADESDLSDPIESDDSDDFDDSLDASEIENLLSQTQPVAKTVAPAAAAAAPTAPASSDDSAFSSDDELETLIRARRL
ncbi:hypothetical protein ABC855_g3923 [[Candida] zeylanoides]